METYIFLFSTYGLLSWIFALGCVLAGVVLAYQRWGESITQILRLRREQNRLNQELALREKSVSQRVAPNGSAPSEASRPSKAVARSTSPSRGRTQVKSPAGKPAASRTDSPSRAHSNRRGSPEPRTAVPEKRRNSLREDRQLGLVFYLAPDDPDPLEHLESITADQVRELNMLGVYRFEQIARWTPENLQAFALLMGFEPEELQAKGWVEQARVLHGETHGSRMILAA